MNWGTWFAFLLSAAMVAVVALVYQEPPAPVAGTLPPVAVVIPVPISPVPAPQSAAAPLSPAVPVRDSGDTVRKRGLNCAVAGATGTGLALAAGPGELAALVAGVTMLAVSPVLVGATLGTIFLTGCAIGVTATPLLDEK